MELSKLASAIYNDIVAGLSGINSNPSISMEQLEDEIIEKRQVVIKNFYLKGVLNKQDLMIALNCVDVDCKDPIKCCKTDSGLTTQHFEIPQLIDDLGYDALFYVGSADRKDSWDFSFYPTSLTFRKYKKRGGDRPYVYIEKTPNSNNMYDGWIYNVPFVKQICVIGIFKDLRQLESFNCCSNPEFLDLGSISSEIKSIITKEKLQYYRQLWQSPQPNMQIPK